MVLQKTPGRSTELIEHMDGHNNVHPAQKALYEVTSSHEMERWQMPLNQLSYLRWYAGDKGARKALDIGVFTGGSALALALGMPEDGQVIACDINSKNVEIGQPFWEEAGVAHKISFVEGPATGTLDRLIKEGQAGTFDLAVVDANKTDYPKYFEQVGALLRVGGVALFDNVFWHGDRVVDPAYQDDPDTMAVLEVSRMITESPQFDQYMMPLSDGIFHARKLY